MKFILSKQMTSPSPRILASAGVPLPSHRTQRVGDQGMKTPFGLDSMPISRARLKSWVQMCRRTLGKSTCSLGFLFCLLNVLVNSYIRSLATLEEGLGLSGTVTVPTFTDTLHALSGNFDLDVFTSQPAQARPSRATSVVPTPHSPVSNWHNPSQSAQAPSSGAASVQPAPPSPVGNRNPINDFDSQHRTARHGSPTPSSRSWETYNNQQLHPSIAAQHLSVRNHHMPETLQTPSYALPPLQLTNSDRPCSSVGPSASTLFGNTMPLAYRANPTTPMAHHRHFSEGSAMSFGTHPASSNQDLGPRHHLRQSSTSQYHPTPSRNSYGSPGPQ